MASPLLDEDVIIRLLGNKPSIEALPQFQHGALQALLDMYDRKVTREVFIENAIKCVSLHTSTSKLAVIDNIHGMFIDSALTDNSFKQATDHLREEVKVAARALMDCVTEMKRCAPDGEPVH